jgi:copper chaperone CopZ
MKTTFTVKGTHCPACKALIEDVCKDIPGVKTCIVDFKSGKTDVEHDTPIAKAVFKKEIEAAGKYKLV